jgi:hypothetical protein
MFYKVFIDPRSTIHYSSYYIQGLYDVLGKKNVRFSSRYFSNLKEIDMLMAFVLIDKKSIKKIIIDYRDQSDIIEDAFLWSDFYAKINVDASAWQHPFSEKLINIPPSFGIKIWHTTELIFHLCNNFVKAKIMKHYNDKNIHLRPQRWLRNYLSLLKRQTLQQYIIQKQSPEDNYVFFVSTLWPNHDNTNSGRYHYILACNRKQDINFEGGFFINKKEWRTASIPDSIPSKLLYYKYLSNKTYIRNIKKSLFVFNTPAVLNCHGWKLGEFLCMGKAIISTPIVNELPVSLEHGKNIYFVNREQDIEKAVDFLFESEDFRRNLEKNAKIYYDNYASPSRVIERIVLSVNNTADRKK